MQSGIGRRKLEGYWNPLLSVENTMGDVGTQTDTEIVKDSSGQAFLIETQRIRGTFSEVLELECFPFDIQVNAHTLLLALIIHACNQGRPQKFLTGHMQSSYSQCVLR